MSLDRRALAALMAYSFPGNVRELENIIQAAIALAPGDSVTEQDLRLEPAANEAARAPDQLALRDVERQHIERVLRLVDGNRQEAARILGIDRSTLYRKLQQFATNGANHNSQSKIR
jgi:DNA-binding NtrC family response regulator